jgi:hypothetical protein
MEEDMEQTHAGGQNAQTESPFAGFALARAPSRAESSLEDGLAQVASAVSALLAHALTIDPIRDEYGHARSRAYDDAVNLLKASAKVGHTIAELRGSKFEHNINVRREAAAAGDRSAASSDRGDDDDRPLIRLGDDEILDWRTRRLYVLQKKAPDPSADGSSGAGAPPRNSEGSNGNFAGAARAADSSEGGNGASG